MAKPLGLWAFVLANTGLFIVSSVLTALSYYAYHQSDGLSSYWRATVGFVFVTLGGLAEPVYQLGIRGNYNLSGTELLLLQSGEGVLIALGLGILFYAITHHNSGSSVTDGGHPTPTDGDTYEFDYQRSDD